MKKNENGEDMLFLIAVLQVLNAWDPAGVKPGVSGRLNYYIDCAAQIVENLLTARSEDSVKEILTQYLIRSYGYSEGEVREEILSTIVEKLFSLPY